MTSVLYDIDVVGYENGLNKLHLFDVETVDESLVKKGITFDKKAIEKNLTLFLYPMIPTKQATCCVFTSSISWCPTAPALSLRK